MPGPDLAWLYDRRLRAARTAKGSQRQSAVQGTCSRFARNATSLVAAALATSMQAPTVTAMPPVAPPHQPMPPQG